VEIPVAISQPAPALIYLDIRLDTPQEAWGRHVLAAEWDRVPLASVATVVNRPARVRDIAWLGNAATPLRDEGSGAWFVKADNDFLAYNATRKGSPYRRSSYFRDANTGWNRREFQNAYYRYVFQTRAPLAAGATHRLRLSNLDGRHPLVARVEAVPLEGALVTFRAAAGSVLFPWTFPGPESFPGPIALRGCRGQRLPVEISVRNFGAEPVEARLRVPPLQREGAEPLAPESIRTVAYQKAAQPRAVEFIGHTDAEIWPSRLPLGDAVETPAGETRTFRVTFRIPEDAAAGEYSGELLVETARGKVRTIPVSVKVLDFDLAPAEVVFGLWDNKLPGDFGPLARARLDDLKEHGINAITTDPYTSPVTVGKGEGGAPVIDASKLARTLDFLREAGMNRREFPFGPLGKMIAAIGVKPGDDGFTAALRPLLEAVQRVADERGMQLYFHPTDEPDIHPARVEEYIHLLKAIKANDHKIWTNNSVAGAMRWQELIDLNTTILATARPAFRGEVYRNSFFGDWAAVEPGWVLQRLPSMNAQVQVRATSPWQTRVDYGWMPYLTRVRGVWGFCYHWNDEWQVTYPFPEAGGTLETTPGWEALREGTYDYRFLETLRKLEGGRKASSFQPPALADLEQLSADDLERYRERVIDAILELRPQP